MGEEKTDQQRTFWPLAWIKDESFWKGVAQNGLSTFLVVVVAYVYGVATGYFERPEVQTTVGIVVSFIFCLLLGTLLLAQAIAGARNPHTSQNGRKFRVFVGIFAVVFVLLTFVKMIFDLLNPEQAIFIWQ